MSRQITCEQCQSIFTLASARRIYRNPLRDLFSFNAEKVSAALEHASDSVRHDVDTFDKVRCPKCGHVQRDAKARFFGVLTARGIKVVVLLFIIGIIGLVATVIVKDLL